MGLHDLLEVAGAGPADDRAGDATAGRGTAAGRAADCTPTEFDCAPEPLPAVTWLTSVNEGLVKQAAYAPSSWKSATVKGPRTSVRTLCQAPEPRPAAPAGPGCVPESWLWQLASAAGEGAAADVGVALQPA